MKMQEKFISDSDHIEKLISERSGDTVVIPKRQLESDPERDWWLIDRAILIPENTTVILDDCKIKLSDRCRDNFFRSANCGIGIDFPERISNIRLIGKGNCVLEGADHPRASGDGGKMLENPAPKDPEDLIKYAHWVSEEHKKSGQLDFFDTHVHTYGTDCGKEGESQYGDWRDIGVLFANVENFSVENLKIVDSHGWAMSFEECAHGNIENIVFDMDMSKMIDGMKMNMENQDGIDLRNGCHDIIIRNISGGTGDDLIALTAIVDRSEYHPGGAMCTTHVMHNDWTKRETGIHDVKISNVNGYCKSGVCAIIRLLPCESEIYNVEIEDVTDTSPEGFTDWTTLLLGEYDGSYGKNLPGSMHDISIKNVKGKGREFITLLGYLENSKIENVENLNENCPLIRMLRKDGMKNVELINAVSPGGMIGERH